MKSFKYITFLLLLCLIGHYTTSTVFQKHQGKAEITHTTLDKLAHDHHHFDVVDEDHDGHIHSINPITGKRYCAVQAYPELMTRTQPDGSILNVYLKGNEMTSYHETEDGYTILKDTDGYFKYANQTASGNLFPSAVIAHNVGTRTTAEVTHLSKTPQHLKYTGSTLAGIKSSYNSNSLGSGNAGPAGIFPPNGARKALLILIDYPDQPFTYNVSSFDSMTNTIGYNVNGQSGSFRDYYFDASNGLLTLQTDVVGWYTADSNRAVYGRNSINGTRPLIRKAVDAAEAAGTDFSQYDGDGDGVVDVVMVIHSGRGMEETGDGDDIWSHRSSLGSTYQVDYDGVTINDYIIQPEALWPAYQIANIGVLCHEFGHALGLPDLYDINSNNGSSAGLGKWDIMAGGTWNNGGATPGYFSAWSKEQLGWVVPTVLTGSGTISNMPAKTASYRINTPNANEYFLMETRQQTEWDIYIPGEGMAIYHIKSDGTNGDEDAKKVDLESADGLTEMDDEINSGDAGDMFPGTTNNTSFDDNTTPDMKLYDGTSTGSSISGISHTSNLVSFNYSVGGGIVTNCISQTSYNMVTTTSAIGQSFTMSGCLSGGYFESIDAIYYDAGGASTITDATIDIYEGDGFSGNLIYSQSNITMSTTGWGTWNQIPLQGGIGSLAYHDDSTYTFKLSSPSNVQITYQNDDYISDGKRYYSDGTFNTGQDLAFKVNVTNTNLLVPTSGIGTASGCIGSTVEVPINITNGDDIGAISYKVTFDTSKVTFTGLSNVHSLLSSNITYTNTTTANNIGEVVIAWWDVNTPSGQDFGTDKLFDIDLVGKGAGVSPINWVTTSPYGELSNGASNVINGATFTNGSVTISNGATAGLTSSDADNTICEGESVTFTATGGVTYDFKLNGTSVQSSNVDTYTTSMLTNGDIVSVEVTNVDGCTDESLGISTIVNSSPIVTLTNDATNNEICAGDNVTFTAGGGDVGATYDFAVNGTSVQSLTSNIFTTNTLSDQDLISVTVTNSTGCTSTYLDTTAYINSALNFDGTDDHVNAGNTVGNFGASDFTAEVWIRTSGTPGDQAILSKRANCTCENFWNILMTPAGNIHVELYENASCGNIAVFTSSNTIADGSWHHVALTRAGNVYTIYIDGMSSYSGTHNVTDLNNTHDFKIGMNGCSPFSFANYFNGDIDEVRLWSVARTASELSASMNQALSGSEMGLDAYYDFNQTTGTSLSDLTGNHNGTLTNMALSGNTSNWISSSNNVTGTGPINAYQTITVNPLPTVSLSSSDADNILCNGETVTFTATGGDTYAFYVNSTLVQAQSTDSTFIISTLADQDTVNVEVFNTSGCSAISTDIIMTVGSTVTTYTVSGGGTYCPSGAPLGIILSNSDIGVNYILVENGTTNIDTLAGTGAALTFNNGVATTSSSNIYTIVAYDLLSPACSSPMTNSAIVALGCFDITMTLNYDNGLGQALKNTPVVLYDNSGAQVGTGTTNNIGEVVFQNITNGSGYYILADLSAKQHGGINGTDALLIVQDFISPTTLQGMKDRAGDVDGNGANNANDALQVANRFVLNPYSFQQDWLHDNDTTNTFAVNGSDVNMTSLVLSFGDVNGSYNASNLNNGTKTEVFISNEGEVLVEAGTTIEIPFFTKERIEAGAVSLVINYPYDIFDIENVVLGKDVAAQNLMYTVANGRIRLTWFSLQPLELNADEALIKIIGKVHTDLSDAYNWTPTITLGNETELADENGDVIGNVQLNIPTIVLPRQTVLDMNGHFQQVIYPNPVQSQATLEYSIPNDANVTIEIFDITGKKVGELLRNETQATGIYELPFSTTHLQNGVYTIKTTLQIGDSSLFYIERMVK